MMLVSNEQESPRVEELTGDYHTDKLLYQRAVQEYLYKEISEIPEGRLRIIVNYIAETMVLSHDKLAKTLRFVVLFPTLTRNGPLVQSGMYIPMSYANCRN